MLDAGPRISFSFNHHIMVETCLIKSSIHYTNCEIHATYNTALTKFFQNPSTHQTYINENDHPTNHGNLDDHRRFCDLIIGVVTNNVDRKSIEFGLVLKNDKGLILDRFTYNNKNKETLFVKPIPLVGLSKYPLRLQAEDGKTYPSIRLLCVLLPNEERRAILNTFITLDTAALSDYCLLSEKDVNQVNNKSETEPTTVIGGTQSAKSAFGSNES